MKEWIVKGTLMLSGVDFYLMAETLEGALAKAALGDFDSYNSDGASAADWNMDPRTLEENA